MSGIIGGAGSKSGIIGQTELDYEEGTWTCTIGTDASNFTVSTSNLFYTKIGRYVYVNGEVAISDRNGNDSGNITWSGFPFVSAAITGNYNGGSITLAGNMSLGAANSWGWRKESYDNLGYFHEFSGTTGTGHIDAAEIADNWNWRMIGGYITTA